MKAKQLFTCIMALACGTMAYAVPVKVTMNNVSTTMSLTRIGSEETMETGEPNNRIYSFDVPAGEYILTAYGTKDNVVNGTIILEVADTEDEQEFKIITNTVYVTNKTDDGTTWTVDNGDYVLDVVVNTREGVAKAITVGKSVTAGRNTFLALNGNSYRVAFIPSETHQAEGYMTFYKAGTLTANVNVNGAIPMGEDYTITLPAKADFQLGMKFTHFTDFTPVEPESTEVNGNVKSLKYRLALGQVYNYRTWKEGGLTQGGYFTMSADKTKRPVISFNESNYTAFDPKKVNHDAKSNDGYETGDIFVNINPQGQLKLNVGDTFDAHAMRTWELTDNSTNNYFIEPDFHYTVVGLDGKPSNGVIEISNANTSVSPWSTIKAVGKGTAIVLVSYDAIGLNYYSGAEKRPYMGGEFWGAIWPQNTGVYVVTVGEGESAVVPNMLINEDYNAGLSKMAGKYVDAEHDVFYYLDTEEGAYYTFTPEGVESITIAYPVIGEQSASYAGFGTEGVTKNDDGSYTLLLKEGRQIVRMTDAAGKSVYQVLTAKSCHREIVNATREGSEIFQPGDRIKIQYSGLFHPANKLAGIYNMSAYVTYNGIPNGSSLILGSGQYTFGSAASAQGVTVDIPESYDIETNPELVMDKGVIQVNGYGDPIGNHRSISRLAGRSPNFTAIAHKTYFGAIPEVRIKLTPIKKFDIKLVCNVKNADINVSFDGKELTAGEDGLYSGTYGAYAVTAVKDGYRCYRHTFTIGDDAEGLQTFNIEMVAAPGAWDGKTITEPAMSGEGYVITNGAELAWLAANVNAGKPVSLAWMMNDIDLGDFDWTPVGTAQHPFAGEFIGQDFAVKGLYINNPNGRYLGLFGYLKDASVSGVSVYGEVYGKQNVAGIAGYMHQNSTVDRCANHADVKSVSSYAGGITSSIGQATSKVMNSYNAGNVSGTNAGGIAGMAVATSTVENVFNVGIISGTRTGACFGGTTVPTNLLNIFAVAEYDNILGQTLVSWEQMRSGEIAYKLGYAFGQQIGVDEYPVLGGMKVIYDSATGEYANQSSGIENIASDSLDGAIYYNLEGFASVVPYNGFNIVVLPDGTTQKLYIK